MFDKRLLSIALTLSLLLLAFGCSREKKTDFELGKSNFLASNYPESSIKLEDWVKKKKNPNKEEAYAMLAVIYHDMPKRQAEYERTMQILKGLGEPGMNAVVKLIENPTVASRLQNTIGDILIQSGSISIAPLMIHFSGANWRLKVHAQQILEKIGETAVPALTNALNSPDRFTKSMSIEALSKINSPGTIPLIEQKLNDSDKLVRVTAAIALHSMGKENPSEIILSSLNDPDIDVRRAAVRAMAQGFENPPISRLLPLLKDADADVRNFATIALGNAKSVESVQSLVREMETDTSEEVRNSAGKALESIGEPSVEPIISLLKRTDDMELVIRIAQILGNIGDKRAVDPLESLYKKEKREMVKNEIAKALNKID